MTGNKYDLYGIKNGLTGQIERVFLAENPTMARCYFNAEDWNWGSQLYLMGRFVNERLIATKVFITSTSQEKAKKKEKIEQKKLEIEETKNIKDKKELIEKLFKGKEIE